MRENDVTLVLTTSNGVRMTALAVESWRRYFCNQPIIVVDDRSEDETWSYLSRLAKVGRNVRMVESNGLNLARSWNAGIAQVQTDIAIVSNNDVIFSHGGLQAVLRGLESSRVGIALPLDQQEARDRCLGPGPEKLADEYMRAIKGFGSDAAAISVKLIGEIDRWWIGRKPISDVPVADPFVRCGGYCFALKTSVWRELGPFNERYEYYGEDWEYFSRCLRSYKMRILGDWMVWHFGQGTSSGAFGSGERFDRLMRARFMLGEDCEGRPETVSIVMPAFGRPKETEAAIASVVAQTRKDWRLYIVDDGSPRGSDPGTVASRFCDPRIGCWRFETNKGPGAARNYGLARTRGKYVAFLDSDDCWRADHLETHLREHENGDLDMTYSDPVFAWRHWDERSGRFVERPDRMPTIDYWGPFDAELLKQKNYILTSSCVLWGGLARSIRFPEDMRVEEDWEYFKQAGRALHIATTTLRYFQRPEAGENLMASHLPAEAPQTPEEIVRRRRKWAQARITVVIASARGMAQLRNALYSCRMFPTVVIADGPVDEEEAKRTFAEFPGACLWRGPGKGPSAARNMGASLARTEWIRFLDDDDVMAGFADPGTDADCISMVSACASQTGIALIGGEHPYTSCIQVKAEAFRAALGFDEKLSRAEERDLVDRIAKAGGRIVYSPDIGALRHISAAGKEWQKAAAHNMSKEDIQERRRRR